MSKKTEAKKSTITISVPIETLTTEITEATRTQLPELKKSLKTIEALERTAKENSPAHFQEQLTKLKHEAVSGNANAIAELTAAGGPEGWLKAKTAMSEIHSQAITKQTKDYAFIWLKFIETAEPVVTRVDNELAAEWLEACKVMGLPAPKAATQFDPADRYPSEQCSKDIRTAFERLKSGFRHAPRIAGTLRLTLVLARIFDLKHNG